MELETSYIDSKYFMDSLSLVKEQELKNRLLNCLLINRHFMLILEKRTPDFTDFTLSKKGLDEKEDICIKYVKSF